MCCCALCVLRVLCFPFFGPPCPRPPALDLLPRTPSAPPCPRHPCPGHPCLGHPFSGHPSSGQPGHPCPGPSKNFAFFSPLPTLFFCFVLFCFGQHPRSSVELRWSLCVFIVENLFTTHIWSAHVKGDRSVRKECALRIPSALKHPQVGGVSSVCSDNQVRQEIDGLIRR